MLRVEMVFPEADAVAEEPIRALVARCGSHFEAPKGLGIGSYYGVEAWSFEPGDMYKCFPRKNKTPAMVCGGVPVWCEDATVSRTGVHTNQSWVAYVGDQYYIRTSDAALMTKALERTGSLTEILQPFPAVSVLPSQVQIVICALPRNDDPPRSSGLFAQLTPTTTMVSYTVPGSPTLFLVYEGDLPSQYMIELGGNERTRRDSRLDKWTVSEIRLGGPESAAANLEPASWLLFGYAVFL